MIYAFFYYLFIFYGRQTSVRKTPIRLHDDRPSERRRIFHCRIVPSLRETYISEVGKSHEVPFLMMRIETHDQTSMSRRVRSDFNRR